MRVFSFVNNSNYTFGDSGEASARLKRLAELYAPETRSLLESAAMQNPNLAVDLGCGPGWSTKLLHDVLQARRTVGLDASKRFVKEARANHGPELEFCEFDVTTGMLPAPAPNAILCRFLLTHLSAADNALAAWSRAAAVNAVLFIHETESLDTENPVLNRYYALVDRLQAHHGQALYIGGALNSIVEESGWKIVKSERVLLEKPAQKMAQLHAPNLRTWRHDKFAKEAFDLEEMNGLESSLDRIARGEEDAGVVVNAARQIVAIRT